MQSLAAPPAVAPLRGPALAAGWLVLGAVAALVATVGAYSFETLLDSDVGLVTSQGPLALQPGLAHDLQQRLFDVDLLKAAQTSVHVAGGTLFAVTAVLVFVRRTRDPVILLSAATLLASGAALFAPSSLLATDKPGWEPVVHLLGVFDASPRFWRSVAGVTLILFALIFPDGRFAARWTRVFAAAVGLQIGGWALLPGSVLDASRWPAAAQAAWTLGIAGALVAAQLHRYLRHSAPEERRKTRLVVVSMTGAVMTFALIWVLGPDLSRTVDLGLVLVTDRLQTIYDLNLLSLLSVSVMLFPVSIGVSVVRYRLFDVDLIVNRALVYGSLTGVIALLLFGAVAIIGAVAANQFGRGLGIAVTGVLMVALFQPLRERIQVEVDRRFYREKYDADQIVARFVEQIRDQADLEVLEAGLMTVLEQTVPSDGLRVHLLDAEGSHRGEHEALAVHYLAAPNRPLLTADGAGPEAPLAALAADGVALVLPLVSHRELVAVVELGRRRGDRPFSGLDVELLRRLAESAAPAFRYADLAERHAREAVARQRYEQELQLARSIQRDLLPKRLPDLPGWVVGAHYQPAREVGGDLYDFIELPEGRWAIIVADVTDKGVPAAMVMATCRSMLRGVATGSDHPGPGEVLRRVNELLIADTPDNMFVTCFYADLDPATGRLAFANAGHPLPLLWWRDAARIEARGMPLGLMPGMAYEEGECFVAPGQSLLLYSDGVTEAQDAGGEMFGTERLLRAVAGAAAGPALLQRLMSDLTSFVPKGADLGDDVTLVALHRMSEAPASRADLWSG